MWVVHREVGGDPALAAATPHFLMLKKLTQAPVPVLPPSVRALRVTMAMRNTHFGARYVLLESETAL